jgi:hypothetical protein
MKSVSAGFATLWCNIHIKFSEVVSHTQRQHSDFRTLVNHQVFHRRDIAGRPFPAVTVNFISVIFST